MREVEAEIKLLEIQKLSRRGRSRARRSGYYPLQADGISGEALLGEAAERARTWTQQGSWMRAGSRYSGEQGCSALSSSSRWCVMSFQLPQFCSNESHLNGQHAVSVPSSRDPGAF